METKKKNNKKNKTIESSGVPWEFFLKIFWQKVEEKIKEGTERINFFLRKKIIALFLIFWGTGLFLVGVVFLLNQLLSSLGIFGAGWLLVGVGCWILASVIGNFQK